MNAKSIRLVVLVSGLALGACAPVTFAGGSGSGIAAEAGGGILATCSPVGGALGLSISGAARAGELRNRVAGLQARFTPGYRFLRAQVSSWIGAASGEC